MKAIASIAVAALLLGVKCQELSKMYTVKSNKEPIKNLLSRFMDSDEYTLLDDKYSAEIIGIPSVQLPIIKSLGLDILEEIEGHSLYDAPPQGYHNPEQLLSEFKNLESRFPTIASVINLMDYLGTPKTHEGRSIFALKISDNVKEDEEEPNILVVSAHHCRELVTPEIALNTSTHLLENYNDPKIKGIVDNNQVYIIWDQNPDGAAYVWARDNMWRKNRKPNTGGSYGIDLNRNYPVGWDFSCGGSTNPSSDIYRGTGPASESETKTMIAFHENRRFSKVLDFHSYAEEVRTIYGDCASLPTLIDNYFIQIAKDYAKQIDYVQARSCCMGGNIHSSYNQLGALSYLVETGQQFQPNQNTMKQVLAQVLPGTLYFLSLPIPVSGTIKDRFGNPVEASIDIDSIKFNLNEKRRSNPQNGLYHLWIPDGVWNVTISANGFQTLKTQVQSNKNGSIQNFVIY